LLRKYNFAKGTFMKILILVLALGSAPAFAAPTFSAKRAVVLHAFAQSPDVREALRDLQTRGSANIILVSASQDACDKIDRYLVVQPASPSDSDSWDAVTATVEIEYNTCSLEPIAMKGVTLTKIVPVN
jgi:hypothetical protein